MAAIDYAVMDNWGSGLVGSMTVSGGMAGLQGWTVEFEATFDISSIWGAEIVSHVGNHYVVRNAAWNAEVAAGANVTFGFQATPGAGSDTAATSLSLNGSSGETPPPPILPTISVADATMTEGNEGTTQLAFTVSLSQASTTPVTVHFTTADGTATAGQDYVAQTGTITFAAGETSKLIHVAVNGDAAVEANEALTLILSDATGATIANDVATGTMVNDDVASPPPSDGGAALDYAVTSNWGAGFTGAMAVEAGSAGLSGWTAEFTASFNITNIWNAEIVSHVGDHYVIRNASWNGQVAAGHEVSFGFQATAGSGGTVASGFTINGTDAGHVPEPPALPTLSVGDATITEGDSGSHDLAFSVSLSAPAAGAVTVAFATSNGTASAGSDYAQVSGTLTFAAGETTKIVHVQVSGDTAVEGNETVALTLSSPQGATVADGSAIGTIINDDAPPPPALPALSISDASVVEGNPGSGGGTTGWLSTSGNQIIDAAGHAVQIAGVNWFGFESSTLAPHGLWTRGYQSMMDQMVDLGFNTIRLPFSSETLHSTAAPNGIDFFKNPDLQGLSALQVMDKIVAYAGEIGLKVILDHHRSDSGPGTSPNGLWYDGQHSEARWVADWQMLAARYADDPTVIGADLHNEPYNGTWGGGGPNDWAAAAELAGNAIGAVNPNWLIFVEGVGTYDGQNYWWGGNLMGVRDRPIELDVANKLVYSAHDYPNSVYAQPWFQDADFAANLPAKFDQMWGYIYREGIAPVYIGEFGTNLVDPKDAPWLEAITSYLGGDFNNDGTSDLAAGHKGPGWTFWSWNPNSGDTGGILGSDWQTPNQSKLAYLTPIEYQFHDDGPGDDSGTPGDANSASFLLTLSEPATHVVTVDYHTVAGEADTADFAGSSGSVTFAAGEQSKTISIPVTPDLVDEGDEHFTVVLTNASGATISHTVGTATIVDDDTSVAPPPPPPADSGDLHALFAVVNAWSGGFNGSVTLENDGAGATTGWQVRVEMAHEITDIWNAQIVSHDAEGYVIRNAAWNGTIAHDGDTSFGFVASGPTSPSTVHVDLDV